MLTKHMCSVVLTTNNKYKKINYKKTTSIVLFIFLNIINVSAEFNIYLMKTILLTSRGKGWIVADKVETMRKRSGLY